MLLGSSLSNRCQFSHRKSCVQAVSNASHADYVSTDAAGGIDSLNDLLDSVAIKPLLPLRGHPHCGRASLRNPSSIALWRDATVTYRSVNLPLTAVYSCVYQNLRHVTGHRDKFKALSVPQLGRPVSVSGLSHSQTEQLLDDGIKEVHYVRG